MLALRCSALTLANGEAASDSSPTSVILFSSRFKVCSAGRLTLQIFRSVMSSMPHFDNSSTLMFDPLSWKTLSAIAAVIGWFSEFEETDLEKVRC